MSRIKHWVGIAGACAMVGVVQANLVTFDGSPILAPGGGIAGGEFFVEDGVYVEAWQDQPVFSSPEVIVITTDAGLNDHLFLDAVGGESRGVAIQLDGGGLFNLISLDVGELAGSSTLFLSAGMTSAPPAGWTGILAPPTPTTLSPAGFNNITTLWLGVSPSAGSASIFIDNIVISAIPEPAALSLLAFGCVALVAYSRRTTPSEDAESGA